VRSAFFSMLAHQGCDPFKVEGHDASDTSPFLQGASLEATPRYMVDHGVNLSTPGRRL
jgi:hypothetical protein